MKAENTECVRVYLRYQNSQDWELKRKLHADKKRGRAVSASVRDALYAYYFPPAPQPAPELQALADEVHQLSQVVRALVHEVNELRTVRAELDAVKTENTQLQNLLLAATYGDRTMKRNAAEVAYSLAVGQQDG